MSCLPQRAPRVHLAGTTPAVLRFEDGQRAAGKLQIVSLTGGLLSLPNPVSQGSQVKLMFLTRTGSVLGGAEMLSPVSSDLQPFRFVSLTPTDRLRLGATIKASLHEDADDQWIEKFRAAYGEPARSRKFVKRVFGAVGLAALGLVSTVLLLYLHLVK